VFTAAGHFVFHGLAARERANSPEVNPLAEQYAAKVPPDPRLQIHPKTDLDALHAAENKTLSRLAWVDKGAGVAQVPIERAMELLVAKNLPARQGPVPAKMAPHGVAPKQYPEGSGAPDWQKGKWYESDQMHEAAHEAAAGHDVPAGHAEAPAGAEGHAH
jgi:hypothetical protein